MESRHGGLCPWVPLPHFFRRNVRLGWSGVCGGSDVEKQNWDGSPAWDAEGSAEPSVSPSFVDYHLVFSLVFSSAKTWERFCQIPMSKRRLLTEFTPRASRRSGTPPRVHFWGRIGVLRYWFLYSRSLASKRSGRVFLTIGRVLCSSHEGGTSLPFYCGRVVLVSISALIHFLWYQFGSPRSFCVLHGFSCFV